MKTKLTRKLILIGLILSSFFGLSQEFNTFDIRYQNNLRGDLTFIGNNIVNRDGGTSSTEPEDPYDLTGSSSTYNDWLNMQYIDVDGDPSTFSSSRANFQFPQANCNLIRYAGLYWSATYPSEQAGQPLGTNRQNDFNQVQFSVPGSGYVTVTADEILFDGFTSGDPSVTQNSPYACYADVTGLITSLADPTGDYTVANIRSVTGSLSPGGGAAGGWTLVVVYENPTLTGKLITTFDGFARVRSQNPTVDINYTGFNTIPAGPVRANIGAAALEGDNRITGDRMEIRAASNPGFTTISDPVNPASNFFNSNITLNGAITTNRTPNSVNTLGYDTDMFPLNNPVNSVIPNDETAATLRFTSSGDQYYPFFNSFNVEIIEPNIVLEKRVEDLAGNDITGAGVNLGQFLDYILTFENIGNDNGTNYTLRDDLPINVSVIEADIVAPAGVTWVYDPVAHDITFTIPDNLIEEGDPPSSIRLRVQVAENCFDFIDACTDLIANQAYSTYQGVINTAVITDDPSVSDFDSCGFVTPGATNFLLDDLENCDFSRIVQLCGNDVLLDAGNNFDDYIWYRDENGNQVIDPGDTVLNDGDPDNDPSTLLVNDIGVYIVDKIVADPCKGFQEIITVEYFGNTQSNPIVDLINDPTNTVEGEVVTCPNDGELLPKIFLCGLNDTELIQINIPDATGIEWERLDETSCAAVAEDCANKDASCTWNNVGSGFNWTASDPGKYRIVINYQNGCFSRFYFDIFRNPLDPQHNVTDIICATPGNITVTNMPADYEYQLLNSTTGAVLVAWGANPSFDISTNGIYDVEMRQQGVVDGCLFYIRDIGVLLRDYQVDVTVQDADCDGLGQISISQLDVEPQYYYEIQQGGTTIDTFGPSSDNNYTFQGLNAGIYDVIASTDDGCAFTDQVTIQDNNDLTLSAQISQHISCREGNIQMDSNGGQTPHIYAIWSFVDEVGNTVISYPSVNDIPASEFQTSVIFDILVPGDYTFVVVDKNNCFAFSNTVTIVLMPSIEYDITTVADETCFGASDGRIEFDLTSTNGYQLMFHLIDEFGNVLASNAAGFFTDLPQGDYTVRIDQTKWGQTCEFFEYYTVSGPTSAVTGNAVLIQDYTCTQLGIIEAQDVTGGDPPYEYSIDGVNFVSGPGAETFSNLTDGTYTITIRDASGCTYTTAQVTIDPLNEPTDLTFTSTAPTCPALTTDLTVTAVNGDAPFVFEITAPIAIPATTITGNTATFDGLAPGTYTFLVTDANNCTYQENYTISPVNQIQVVGQLVSNVTCVGDSDGEISFTVSDFVASYDYTVTGPAAFTGTAETSSTLPFTGLPPGTYTITVIDNDTNCAGTADVTVNEPATPLALTVTPTEPSCTADGSALLTATGGWGSYTYTLTYPDTVTVVSNSSGSFTGLNQGGTYTAEVTDANGCVVSTTFDLTAATIPVLTIVPNDPCYDDAVGLTLTANVTSGGDGNFQYRLNGGAYQPSNIFSGLGPGTYTIDVIDGKSCTATASITIDPELVVTASANNIPACGTDTDVTIVAAGGDGAYIYALVNDGIAPVPGDFGAANNITVTGPGDYDVYVRDNNGTSPFCEAMYDITIAQDPALALTVTSTPITCSGESEGSITITATGGTGIYEYSIDNGTNYQLSNVFNNLSAGSYTIRVRDSYNCEISQIHTVNEPLTLSASAAVTRLIECDPAGGAEVRITNPQGGTQPYEYSFDNQSTWNSSNIGYLFPGDYIVYVRDANNCIYGMPITVPDMPTPPDLATTVDYECDGEGTITVVPSSAAFDYTYEINGVPNTPDTSNVFSDVPVGTHTITVNYVSNAVPTPSILLSEDFGVGPNTSITEVDPAYCYEPQDGSPNSCSWPIDNRIEDGEYSVTQVIANPWPAWLSPNDQAGVPNGRFLAMNVGGVVGPNGIIYAKPGIEVIPNRDITISLYAFNLVRQGQSAADPDINIQLVDGVGTVVASTTTGNVPKNTGVNDWHNYTVVLNPGANTNLDIVIRTNSAVLIGNDIAIDNIQAWQMPEVCPLSVTTDVVVEDGNAFDALVTATDNISCNAGSDGSITFEVYNFDTVNGFEYSLNGGAFSAPQTSTPITVSGLSAGNYTIDVRDVLDNSCAVTLNHTLTEPAVLAFTFNVTPFTCDADGYVDITPSGGTPSYTYELVQPDTSVLGPQGTNIFTGLNQPGNYTIRVTDANGCVLTDTFAMTTPDNPVASIDPASDLCYSSADLADVVVGATGGLAPYYYSINGGPTQTSNTFNGLIPGNYTFTVRDSNGCTDDVLLTIEPELTATAVLTKDIDCTVTPEAIIDLTVSGGYAPYAYEININSGGYVAHGSGFPYSTSVAGTYQFRITDSQGCIAESNVITVTPATNPSATETLIHPTCNGDANGIVEIEVDPNFGTPPYQISFDGSPYSSQTIYTGLAAGTYNYAIVDGKNCSYAGSATLVDPALFTANVVPTDVACGGVGVGDIPGKIDINITSGGVPNFTYALYDNLNNIVATTGPNPIVNTPATSVTFDGLGFGDYYVRIIDANGCEYYENPVRVRANPYLSVNSTVIVDCPTGGTVELSSDGGSGDYTFTIYGTGTGPTTEVPGPGPLEETATFTGLNAGQTYVFQVVDNVTACTSFIEETIPTLSAIDVVATPTVTDVSCSGTTDGSITFQVEGFDASVTTINYSVLEALTNNPLGVPYSGSVVQPLGGPNATPAVTINNIPPGDYVLLFEEATSPFCSNTYDFRILEPLPVVLNLIDQNNGNCTEDAQVTVLATGGTAPYTYAFVEDGNIPLPIDYTASNYAELDPAVNTDWDVYVLDNNGCTTAPLDVTIAADPEPVISGVVTNQCMADEGSFIIRITLDVAGIPPHRLSINGGAYQPTTLTNAGDFMDITGLSSGSYTFDIRDANDCGVGSGISVEVYPPSSMIAEAQAQPTCLGNDGEILITAFGGSGVYTYELFLGAVSVTGGPQAAPLFTGLAPGVYTAFVYDSLIAGCDSSADVTLEVPTAVSFTTTHTDVSCLGSTDGTITATLDPGNDNPPYVYELYDSTGTILLAGPQTNNIFTGLAPATYEVAVRSARLCESRETVIIDEPAAIIANAAVVEFACSSGNSPGVATITVDNTIITGGSGNYVLYEFINDQGTPALGDDVVVQSGSSTIYVETDLAGGSYIINVYDDNGCVGSTNALIQPYDELISVTPAITNAITCNPGMDGEITLTVTSTNMDPTRFEYSNDGGATYQASNVFSGLDFGVHVFTVRHIDTGCIITTTETIDDPNTFDIVVTQVQNVSCFGTQTGAVTFELTDATYVGPFDWFIYDINGTPADRTDDILVDNGNSPNNGPTAPIMVFAGEYLVEITQTNDPQCTNIQYFNIAGPPAPITASTTVTPITCLGNDGIIEIINVAGGWGGYSYYVGAAPPAGPASYVASPVFSGLGVGTYEAWVLDANGCETLVQNNLVLVDPTPITATLQVNQENCINLQGEIEVVGVAGGQGSNYLYQLIKDAAPFGSPQTSPVFSGLGAGAYEVIITDDWSCTFTTPAEILYEEMILNPQIVKLLDCTVNPDGEITINVTGGSGNYDFTVTFPDLVTTMNNGTGIFTGLSQDGTYTFDVLDLGTTPNCAKQVTVDLDAPSPVVFDPHTVIHVSCNGANDGSITVNLAPVSPGVNDNPPYVFNLYDGGVLVAGPQASPIFTGLPPASYEVEAVSARGCFLREVVVVTEPTPLTATATATAFVCTPSNNVDVSTVIVDVPAGSGTAPYLYSLDNVNFQTSNQFDIVDNGSTQNITLYVVDANGCMVTTSVTIDPINSFTAAVTQVTPISCVNPEQILITVTDDGNPANTYTYELLPIGNPDGTLTGTPTNVTATYDLTAVGSYVFRITDTNTGCYIDTAPYDIAPYDLIDVVAQAVTPVTCFGDANGELSIDISGFTGNYDYEVFTQAGASTGITGSGNTAVNPLVIGGLSGGNYFVRVTETTQPFCVEDSNVITIISPDMPLTAALAEVANVTCTNDQGEISVIPDGGYAPYDIVLTNNTTSQTYSVTNVSAHVFTGLSEGNFTATITDNNGCVITENIALVQPAPISANISATPTLLACFGDTNATVTAINVVGGQGSYQYRLNYYDSTGTTLEFTSGGQVNPVFNNLGAGVYSITVSDGWNCDVETPQVTISEPTEVMASLIELSPMSCTNQAQIELTASGGTGPYEYSTDDVTYLPMSGGNTHTFTVNPGVYQYYVRDSFNCIANISNQVSVEAVPPLTITIDDSAAMINCTGEATATLIAEATGGLGNYSYELFADAALTNLLAGPQASGEFNTLPAGSYYIRVTSQDCVEVSPEVIITEPVPLQIDRQEFTNVTCAGDNDGTITVEVSGGTGIILYAITPNLNQFDDVNVFTDLEPGVYDVIAQDQNGCFIPFQFTINEPPALTATFTTTPEVCAGEADGSITVSVTGGTAPYSTAFNSNNPADFVPDQFDFNGLASGTYVIFIRDAAGCETNVIVEVGMGVNLNAVVEPVYVCTDTLPENYINITFEDETVIGSVMYALDSADPADLQLNPDFQNIPAGDHYVTVAHANGCVQTIDFSIDSFEPLALTLQQNNLNEITAVATGGTTPYTFYFGDVNNGTDNTYYINRTDTYTVRVIDDLGCIAEAQIFMEFIDIEIPNYFTPDGDGFNDTWAPRNREGWPEILIKIYDRYGRVVAQVTNGPVGWDGTYQGKELPTGDYWYVIKLNGENDDREFVGHFTLYR